MRYAGLDGLRGIAAVAVLLLHTSEFTLRITYANAGLAVDFFFLLSGFILARVYPAPGLSYLVARLIRLYPLYIAGVLLGALVIAAGLTDTPETILPALGLNVAMLPAFELGENVFPFDHPLWSIAYELVLSFGWFAFARWLGGWRLWATLAGLVALWLAFPEVTMLRAAVPFVAGVGICRLHRVGLKEPWAIATAGALAAILFFPLGAIQNVVADVAFAAIVAAGAALRLAELTPAALYLGRISYPLYVFHWPLCWWAQRNGLMGPLGLVAVLTGTWLLAHLALTLYDEPVRAWLTRRLSYPTQPRPVQNFRY